jgi:hypothetical protein
MVPAATRGLTPSRWELKDMIISQQYPPQLAPLIYILNPESDCPRYQRYRYSRANLKTLSLRTGEVRQNAKELLLRGGGARRHGADAEGLVVAIAELQAGVQRVIISGCGIGIGLGGGNARRRKYRVGGTIRRNYSGRGAEEVLPSVGGG